MKKVKFFPHGYIAIAIIISLLYVGIAVKVSETFSQEKQEYQDTNISSFHVYRENVAAKPDTSVDYLLTVEYFLAICKEYLAWCDTVQVEYWGYTYDNEFQRSDTVQKLRRHRTEPPSLVDFVKWIEEVKLKNGK